MFRICFIADTPPRICAVVATGKCRIRTYLSFVQRKGLEYHRRGLSMSRMEIPRGIQVVLLNAVMTGGNISGEICYFVLLN